MSGPVRRRCAVIPLREGRSARGPVWEPVFVTGETDYYCHQKAWEWTSSAPPRNPGFRADLVISLTHQETESVLKAADIDWSEQGAYIGIKALRRRLSAWLRRRVWRGELGVQEATVMKVMTVTGEGLERGATHVFIG